MTKKLSNYLLSSTQPTLTDAELAVFFGGNAHSRYGIVKRALAKGDLIWLRRGLYAINEKYLGRPLNLFDLSERIYGPSYVSFESALSYHGLIPEAVHTITCACVKRSKDFKTPFGLFSYVRLPARNFYSGVDHIQKEATFYVASPWKALMDLVYVGKKKWVHLDDLVDDMRVELEILPNLDDDLIVALTDFYESKRMEKFIHKISKEVKYERASRSRQN